MIDDLTIVVVWYKKNQLDEFMKNINRQRNIRIKIITLDNSKNSFVGAREAFNSVIKEIGTKYVAFSHPDVNFEKEDEMENMLHYIKNLNNIGIVGIAGCKEGRAWEILSNITHGSNKSKAGREIKNVEIVQTVDECLFFLETKTLIEHPFSDIKGWHMYAVEQCLELETQGYTNYVIPSNVWHRSAGNSLDPSYVVTLKRIIKKYSNKYKYINTTVKQWKTRGIGPLIYREYYYFKQLIKRKIK